MACAVHVHGYGGVLQLNNSSLVNRCKTGLSKSLGNNYIISTKRSCITSTNALLKEVSHKDSWLDKQMIHLFVKAMSTISGRSTNLEGYDAFIDISRKMMHGRSATEQHEMVEQVLESLMPKWVGKMARAMFPPSKFTAEFYAYGTTLFSAWLIGPSKVIEVEVKGVKQNSGVRIEKCRFLENSKCVGMCTNLCKVPSQKFLAKELGVPMTMVPNFEDMSCEFIYGQSPLSLEEDPASKQPCYHGLCPTAKQKQNTCPKLR